MAALLVFYHATERGDGCLLGHRGEQVYEIHDDADKLEQIAAWAALPDAEYVDHILKSADWWGEDLTAIPGFAAAVQDHFQKIRTYGAKAYIESLGKEE